MRLRRNEFCPIHRSLFCCGRETLPKPRLVRLGVQRVEDPHHPRGYRELRSPAEMRKLLNRKVREQAGICAICHEAFTDYNDIVPDHKNPKGMGGAWRDDHPDNIQATHWWCNGGKGSTRGRVASLGEGDSCQRGSFPQDKVPYSSSHHKHRLTRPLERGCHCIPF
jgi:hypothetical protein